MLHFLTGMYYFTWFENLLIIIAGLSLGHFLNLIVRQVIAIRNGRSLTKIIRTMIPWLVLLLVLMLSPVFASRIAVGWMVIIGIVECTIEQLVITKFGQQLTHQRAVHHPARQHAERLTQRRSNNRSVQPEHHSADKQQSTEREQSAKLNAAAKQAQSAELAAKPAAPAAQQPVKSAGSASTTEHQSPAVTNQAASATATTESQPETSAPESHQPTSQEIMDHMFDFDPNVDYEAEAKAAAAAAEADKQSQEEDTHDKN